MTLALQHEALGAADLHDSQPVAGAHFLFHAVKVIFDGLLGEAEVVGNFLVGEALRDQRNQLLLPAGQPQLLMHGRGRKSRCFLFKITEHRRAQGAGTNRVPRLNCLDRAQDVVR